MRGEPAREGGGREETARKWGGGAQAAGPFLVPSSPAPLPPHTLTPPPVPHGHHSPCTKEGKGQRHPCRAVPMPSKKPHFDQHPKSAWEPGSPQVHLARSPAHSPQHCTPQDSRCCTRTCAQTRTPLPCILDGPGQPEPPTLLRIKEQWGDQEPSSPGVLLSHAGHPLATLAMSYLLLPTGMGSGPQPGHVDQPCDPQPRVGGPCCGDTSDAHSDQCEAAGREARGQGQLGRLPHAPRAGAQREPHAHLPPNSLPPGLQSPACSPLWPSAASGHPHGGSAPPVWAAKTGSRGASELKWEGSPRPLPTQTKAAEN